MGLPNLSDRDQERVDVGNRLLRITCRLCRVCHYAKVGWAIENPGYSRLWITEPMKNLIQQTRSTCTMLDFCQYNEKWRKRTRIQHGGSAYLSQLEKLCHMTNYCCSATGKRHYQLSGTNEKGEFKTHLAQAYPKRLVTAIASMLGRVAHPLPPAHSEDG